MSRPSGDTILVLHVDDDPDFADMTKTFLERQDDRFRVDIATSANDGLERLGEAEYDCIVSDYDMPNMDGIEFLRAVREDYPNRPFILFTGKGSEEVASEAISASVTDYLQKDTGAETYELLANRIENAVAQTQAIRQATEQSRLLRILRDVNQALVSASTRNEVEAAVTNILADAEPYGLAWFGHYDQDSCKVDPRAVAGVDCDAESAAVNIEEIDVDGALSRALRSEEVVVNGGSSLSEDIWSGEPPISYEAAAVVPIVYHGDCFGMLTLYASQADVFDTAERKMLNEIAGDVAQALHTVETRRTLRRHQTAVETVPEGVFILDEEANVVLINEAAATLADRTPEEVRGESFETFVERGIFDEEIVEWYLETVRTLLSSNTDTDGARYQTELQLPDDEMRTVEIHLALRPYEEEYRGTVGIIRDVDERIARERALEESKERYRRLVENAPVPIAIYDEDGVLVYVNDSTVSLLGATDRESVLGVPAREFVHPDDHEIGSHRLKQIIDRREAPPPTELSLVDRNGSRKDVIISSVPVRHDDAPAGQAVLKDITELKVRERALQRQRDRLDKFASVLTHDLRNPLNVAMGRVKMANQDCDSEHLKEAISAQERMKMLIDELLAYARLGETSIEAETLNLAEMAKTSWQNVKTADATFVNGADQRIRGDRNHVQRLLENLLRNAIEHGGSDVMVTIGGLPKRDGFYVEDDGPGIAESTSSRLFDFGYSTKEDGTGFGLAIVKEVVEAHGWSISVCHGSQGGARFEVSGVEIAGD